LPQIDGATRVTPDQSTPATAPITVENSTESSNGADRREYFRVEDRALLRYCAVSTEAVAQIPAETHFADTDLFWLLRELRHIDRENHNVLRNLAEQNRELGLYLRGINRKLELMASAMLSLDPNRTALAPQDISLSEGGLSLLADPKLGIGSTLALELTLLPEQIGIVCYGEVIANRDEPPARTAIRFLQMPDSDRQLIAKHIFQVQIAARRVERDAADIDSTSEN